MALVTGQDVAQWVYEKTGGCVGPHTQGLGYAREGVLIAGFAFEGYNGYNVFGHSRIDAPAPRGLWKAAANHIFITMGCTRFTGYVAETNENACRLDEHVGMEYETRLAGAAHDGSDLLIYVLWKNRCRMLDW